MHRGPGFLLFSAAACCSAVFCTALSGCQWLNSLGPSPKVNPVMGEPPPRLNVADRDNRPGNENPARNESPDNGTHIGGGKRGISQVSQIRSNDPDEPVHPDDDFVGTQIVATVNGTPILASDVLERYKSQFRRVQSQATPAQLRTIRERLIKRDLETHVESTLLAEALKASLPPEALEKLDEAVNKAFEKHIDRMKKEMQVATKADVQARLAEDGTTLATLRDMFANQQLAAQYFQQQAKKEILIGRREILEYYESHLPDYAIPAKVRWQEIQISFDEHGGRDEAFAVLQKAIDELKQGSDFGAVAKKYSDGTTANNGGKWDWTISGSLTDECLDTALFELPVGPISQVMEDESSFRLIKVLDRTSARWKPFEKVQDDIKTELETQARKKAAREVLDKLMSEASITTIFDNDPDFQPRWKQLQR